MFYVFMILLFFGVYIGFWALTAFASLFTTMEIAFLVTASAIFMSFYTTAKKLNRRNSNGTK